MRGTLSLYSAGCVFVGFLELLRKILQQMVEKHSFLLLVDVSCIFRMTLTDGANKVRVLPKV